MFIETSVMSTGTFVFFFGTFAVVTYAEVIC